MSQMPNVQVPLLKARWKQLCPAHGHPALGHIDSENAASTREATSSLLLCMEMPCAPIGFLVSVSSLQAHLPALLSAPLTHQVVPLPVGVRLRLGADLGKHWELPLLDWELKELVSGCRRR